MSKRWSLFGIVLLVAVSGLYVSLQKSESSQPADSNSDLSQDQPAGAPTELSQKEIEDLLDLKGVSFIELARFEHNTYDDYQQYESRIQEIMGELGDYHRFVVDSRFRKPALDETGLSHEKYYRVLIGPFTEAEAPKALRYLVGAGYRDAFVTRIVSSDELNPVESHRLLLLHVGNKGPKFTSGWLHHWFGYIEYVLDARGKRILFHSLNTYRGDRNGGRLFLADGTTGTISNLSDFSQGFVLLPDSERVLVQKSFSIETKEPLDYFEGMRSSASLMDKLDKADLDKVANEIGVAANRIQVQATEKPVATVSVLFELDLRTRESKSLRLFGGFGGIFMLKDGVIYLSNNYTTASYRGLIDLNEPLGIFGQRPYQLVDLRNRVLIDMPSDFQPDSSAVVQPKLGRQSEKFTIVAETGVVKLLCFKDGFFLQH